MKYFLTLAAIAALFTGCASQGGMGGTEYTTTGTTPAEGPVVVEGTATPMLPFLSPGNDRNDTGTTSGTGVSDLGAASPSDQQQREPYDPRLHRP